MRFQLLPTGIDTCQKIATRWSLGNFMNLLFPFMIGVKQNIQNLHFRQRAQLRMDLEEISITAVSEGPEMQLFCGKELK